MKYYKIPESVREDIAHLSELLDKFGDGAAPEVKAFRVPFGIYEQRKTDSYMIRLRCPGGLIGHSELLRIVDITEKSNINSLHITTRQELQIHDVNRNDIIGILSDLANEGLSSKGGGGNTVRNITSSYDSGLNVNEAFDVNPYVIALTDRMIEEEDSYLLPRKYKIAFSSADDDKANAGLSDLGFIAKVRDNVKGFKVYIAGGLGGKPVTSLVLFDFIEAGEVYNISKALKNLFFKYGNRKNKHAARIRFLRYTFGDDGFLEKFHYEYNLVKKEKHKELEVNEIRYTDNYESGSNHNSENDEGFNQWKSRFTTEQKQNGYYIVIIPVSNGFFSNEYARIIALTAGKFGEHTIRFTPRQNIALCNIPGNGLIDIYMSLKGIIKEVNSPLLENNILSCAGASTCQLGICLSRGLSDSIRNEVSHLESSIADKLSAININISGCPNSCGQHQAGDIGLSGKGIRNNGKLYPAYSVFWGSTVNSEKTILGKAVFDLPAKNVPVFIKDILLLFYKSGQTDFRSYIESLSEDDVKGIVQKYSKVPDFESDPSFYKDFGSDLEFSLADRRTGECSAGLFDLIDVDMQAINRIRREISSSDGEVRNRLILDLLYTASRALLITRGLEAKNGREAVAMFKEYFLDKGLISDDFRSLIERAADNESLDFIVNLEETVIKLSEAVTTLYDGMDNMFNFSMQTVKEGGSDVKKYFKDLRGVACPMNFVKTKHELSKLRSKEVLEIYLDDGMPIENVPGSVKGDGHKILEQKKIENYWSVLIEKG